MSKSPQLSKLLERASLISFSTGTAHSREDGFRASEHTSAGLGEPGSRQPRLARIPHLSPGLLLPHLLLQGVAPSVLHLLTTSDRDRGPHYPPSSFPSVSAVSGACSPFLLFLASSLRSSRQKFVLRVVASAPLAHPLPSFLTTEHKPTLKEE